MSTIKPAVGHTAEPRVYMQDVIPYEAPERLEDIHGPSEGILTLPLRVYWGPKAECDLGEPEDVIKAYQAILREAVREDQEELLNAALLRQMWGQLMLPARCRDLWENRFPQLAQQA